MKLNEHDSIRPILWVDNCLKLLDQRLLPVASEWIQCHDVATVAACIHDMVVRGAPAIGITAAYGVVLAARQRIQEDPRHWKSSIEGDLKLLADARPTAVNLFWALDLMGRRIKQLQESENDPVARLLETAHHMAEADLRGNHRIGELGAALIGTPCKVLTHCNAGALATSGYGTALGVIRSGYARGVIKGVFANETRPWLQGARLTAWELIADRIPVTLVAEGAAAHLMSQGMIKWVVVGADRIAANGDVANKIGTCNLAIIAQRFGVKMMVAAPTSTIDRATPDGGSIPIEERDAAELLSVKDCRFAAEGAEAWNPVFDITPAELVTAIVTERGVIANPDESGITAIMESTQT